MKPRLNPTGKTSDRARGMVLLEFILTLPFFVLIILLLFNMGKAYYLKQRVVVAARHATWYDAHMHNPISAQDLERHCFNGEEGVRITRIDMSTASRAELERELDHVPFGGALLNQLFSRANDTKGYTVSYPLRPMNLGFLPESEVRAHHILDTRDWRYEEMPEGYWGIIKGQFGRLAGRVFRFFNF